MASLCAFAPSDTPRFNLQAEWTGAPCMDPGEIRVTLTNIGAEPFSVPASTTVGWGAMLNVLVSTKAGTVGSEASMAPPHSPNFYEDPEKVIRLQHGQSIALNLPTGSDIGEHVFDGPPPGPAQFHGSVRAYYTLPATERSFGSAPVDLLVMDPAAAVYSNILTCP